MAVCFASPLVLDMDAAKEVVKRRRAINRCILWARAMKLFSFFDASYQANNTPPGEFVIAFMTYELKVDVLQMPNGWALKIKGGPEGYGVWAGVRV